MCSISGPRNFCGEFDVHCLSLYVSLVVPLHTTARFLFFFVSHYHFMCPKHLKFMMWIWTHLMWAAHRTPIRQPQQLSATITYNQIIFTAAFAAVTFTAVEAVWSSLGFFSPPSLVPSSLSSPSGPNRQGWGHPVGCVEAPRERSCRWDTHCFIGILPGFNHTVKLG